jgi:hypothetical protein
MHLGVSGRPEWAPFVDEDPPEKPFMHGILILAFIPIYADQARGPPHARGEFTGWCPPSMRTNPSATVASLNGTKRKTFGMGTPQGLQGDGMLVLYSGCHSGGQGIALLQAPTCSPHSSSRAALFLALPTLPLFIIGDDLQEARRSDRGREQSGKRAHETAVCSPRLA